MAVDTMGDGPSEAELELMLTQMREAPAEQVLVEVVNVLLQAAQVKLGRADARLLIDAVAALAQAVSGRADEALLAQIGQAVTRIRMAQVEAEGGQGGDAQVARADVAPGAPESAPAASQGSGAGAEAPQRSRLWTPGG